MRPSKLFLLALALLPFAAPALAQTGPSGTAAPAAPGGSDPVARLMAAAGPRTQLVRRAGFAGVFIAYGMRVPTSAIGDRPESFAAAAVDFLARHGDVFGVTRDVPLRIEAVRSAHGLTVVRFTRTSHGEPVVGESVNVRFLPWGAIDHVTARLSLARDRGDARVLDASAGGVAGILASRVANGRVESTAAVRVVRDGAIVPAWFVAVEGSAMVDRVGVVVDARDGTPVTGRVLTWHARGRVYDPNPTVAMNMTSDLELLHLTSRERLTGRYIRAQNCVSTSGDCRDEQVAMSDAAGDFLFDPEEPSYDDPFSEVMAYFHGDRVAAYFREAHAFEWRCEGASSSVMPATVNLHSGTNEPYDNAAYQSGSCRGMIFGQSATRDFAYDADVMYHEFTHGVVDQTASLSGVVATTWGLSYDPLSLNEGTADFFSATVSGDPDLAEYLASGAFGSEFARRTADNDLTCPQSLFGEGHYDGRIWSGTGWDIHLAIGAEKAANLYYTTLNTISDAANFDEAGSTLISTAEAFVESGDFTMSDLESVRSVVTARGLVGCEGIVTLEDNEEYAGFSGVRPYGLFYGGVAPLLYRIDFPPDAVRLALTIEPITVSGRYTVVISPGEIPRNRGGELRGAASYDHGELFFDRVSTPPVVPCTTWYIGLVAEDLEEGESAYGISANVIRSGELDGGVPGPDDCNSLPPDAGVPDSGPADEDAGSVDEDGGSAGEDAGGSPDATAADAGSRTRSEGGCGCRVPAGTKVPGAAWLVMGLALLGLAVRRRTRR